MKRFRANIFNRLSVLLLLSLASPAAFAQYGDIRRVHDPRIAKCGDFYYLFSTGVGIPIRRSPDLIQWERVGTVFSAVPGWAKAHVPGVQGLWAPDICFFDGKYRLYYAASTFGRNGSCIGLATNVTLDPANKNYRWVDEGKVIDSMPGRDNWNAIDPNFTLDEQGRPWLAWGSFWSGIKLRQLDPVTGKPPADAEMFSIAARPAPDAIEAPFLIRHDGWFYLFVSFDYCARGSDSTYKIMVGRAKTITGPYEDKTGQPMLKGGGSLILAGYGDVRGPGHNAVLVDGTRHWLIHHYYDARERGIPKLQIRPLSWDDDGWPKANEPLPETAPVVR